MPRLPAVLIAAAVCGVHPAAALADATDDRAAPVTVRVPFATNRAPLTGRAGDIRFGEDHGDRAAGYCTVHFESASLEDGGELVEVGVAPLLEVLGGLASGGSAEVVLYVHGYGENFDRNCRRAAVLQARAALDGKMLLFSWPANLDFLDYAEHVRDLEASVTALTALLDVLAARFGAENVHLLGHSLGARGLVAALVESPSDVRFGQLVLVAPDIDREVFEADLPALLARTAATTVYVSDNDRLLLLSRLVNFAERLGSSTDLAPGAAGLAVVDVSPTGREQFSGHVYHLYNPAVIEDLRRTLALPLAGPARYARRAEAPTQGLYRLVPIGSEPPGG